MNSRAALIHSAGSNVEKARTKTACDIFAKSLFMTSLDFTLTRLSLTMVKHAVNGIGVGVYTLNRVMQPNVKLLIRSSTEHSKTQAEQCKTRLHSLLYLAHTA